MSIILAKALIVLFFVVWVVAAVKLHKNDSVCKGEYIFPVLLGFFFAIIAIGMIVFCSQLILFLFCG